MIVSQSCRLVAFLWGLPAGRQLRLLTASAEPRPYPCHGGVDRTRELRPGVARRVTDTGRSGQPTRSRGPLDVNDKSKQPETAAFFVDCTDMQSTHPTYALGKCPRSYEEAYTWDGSKAAKWWTNRETPPGDVATLSHAFKNSAVNYAIVSCRSGLAFLAEIMRG